MKFIQYFFISISCIASSAIAQDTFSIVAVDSSNREVGSAGASCIDLIAANILDPTFIGDLIPDSGAINTQASYLTSNQINARLRMRSGDSPDQMINWLKTNDAGNDSTIRQYAIASFNGNNPSAAGYSGSNCMNYKNHISGNIHGIYYTIAGNILLGKQILDSMEYKFRNANGDLACRLMAGLQGANVVGANTRCTPYNTSSLFAFLMVAQKTDNHGDPSYVCFVRTAANSNIEPIDTLQKKFSSQHACIQKTSTILNVENKSKIAPNPSSGNILVTLDYSPNQIQINELNIYNTLGDLISSYPLTNDNTHVDLKHLSKGMYFYHLNANNQSIKMGKLLIE